MTRYGWLVLLVCLGCQSTLPRLGDRLGDRLVEPGDRSHAGALGALGHRAERVSADQRQAALAEASRPSQAPPGRQIAKDGAQPVAQPVALAQEVAAVELLKQATASYERGDDRQAIDHLQAYVAERSEHLIARAQLAELLFRQERHDEARLHFELFIAQAQEHGDLAFRYLIHSHSRLVEIAEQEEDEYEERLNRGIGLYLLACRRAGEPHSDEAPAADALWCKAAVQLQEARRADPEEARPDWYLYQVWCRLGQHSAARKALADADAQAFLSRLTPPERRQLHAACLHDPR